MVSFPVNPKTEAFKLNGEEAVKGMFLQEVLQVEIQLGGSGIQPLKKPSLRRVLEMIKGSYSRCASAPPEVIFLGPIRPITSWLSKFEQIMYANGNKRYWRTVTEASGASHCKCLAYCEVDHSNQTRRLSGSLEDP